MLTPEGCSARRRRLWGALPRSCDLLIIGDPQHLIYFANFEPSLFEFRSNDAGAFLVLEPDRATLVADSMLRPYIDRAHVDEVVAPDWYNGKTSAPHRQSHLVHTALDRLKSLPGTRIGIEAASVPAGLVEGLRAARPGLELVDLDPVVRPLRRVKDADEMTVLRRSMALADLGYATGMEQIAPGMTEVEAFALIQRAITEAAGGGVRIYGDFVSGPRCEKGGGPPSDRKIERGDLVLLDFSVVVRGYRGDYANTFVVAGGTPTARQQELFEACVEALSAGEGKLKAGVAAKDVDAAVRASFAKRGLAGTFTSHSGHGIGLGHPEPPYFVPESSDVLVAGDVVTLEPGQYIEGVAGMRYERNYLVTADGYETLSGHRIAISSGTR